MALLGKNTVYLQDSWLGLGAEILFRYYDLTFEYLYFKNPFKDPSFGYASSYYALYIVQNEATFTEERQVNNLIGAFAKVGGLTKAIMVAFAILVGSTEQFYYYQRLMKELLLERD